MLGVVIGLLAAAVSVWPPTPDYRWWAFGGFVVLTVALLVVDAALDRKIDAEQKVRDSQLAALLKLQAQSRKDLGDARGMIEDQAASLMVLAKRDAQKQASLQNDVALLAAEIGEFHAAQFKNFPQPDDTFVAQEGHVSFEAHLQAVLHWNVEVVEEYRERFADRVRVKVGELARAGVADDELIADAHRDLYFQNVGLIHKIATRLLEASAQLC